MFQQSTVEVRFRLSFERDSQALTLARHGDPCIRQSDAAREGCGVEQVELEEVPLGSDNPLLSNR